MPHPITRTVTKHRTRTRRFYACHRHPNQPVTGFCALCLKDRLNGLDSSSGQLASSSAPVPEFRRSKSVAVERCKDVNDLDPRRSSCDVRARSTLSDLFVVDDKRKSMKLGFSTKECVEEEEGIDDDEIRALDDVIELNHEIRVSDDDEVIEGDLKTMKEIIDMELNNNNINNNNNNNKRYLRSAASAFSQKLRKWREKEKEKKQSRNVNNNGGNETTENDRSDLGQLTQFRDAQSDYGFSRRSCDTEPRFSIDAHRLSVEDHPRFSLDERRVSWDGYMTAKTIPRLTPMLSVVDNMMLGPVNRATVTTVENNLQMHSISEDGASSGGSGLSNSDCSSSNRGSSSSSSTKTAGFGGDDVNSASNARVSPASNVIFQGTKLVITEKELKDWHLNSIKSNNSNSNAESASNAPNSTSKTSAMNIMNPSNELKKKVMSSRWRKVCNLWGHKHKLDDKIGEIKNAEHIPVSRAEIGNSSAKLVKNTGSVKSRTRRDEFVLDRNRSTRYSTSDIDSGLLRLYLTPFRNSRRNKFGRSRAPPSMITNGLQLH